jgi:RNA polymerase sigma factor (sigma-70 family)
MEAATAAPSLLARARAARFERECERLRPLGEAYVLRRFGGSLGRADAEDAVAEVLIRLHCLAEEGRPPQNLRATFFASVRNQAIDQLRARAARPTVELEAAGELQAGGRAPAEWAESHDDAARLQEAFGRMRGNYREAIMLRYGLGMTVPEIAEHCQISLAAAKKLVLRATAQARARMEAVEGSELCPEIREQARRLVVEKEASGLGEDGELALLRAHLAHCGHCRSFLASLHGHLHDLGSAAVFGFAGAERFGAHPGILDGLGNWGSSLADAAHSGGDRARALAYKAGGAFGGSDGAPASALLSTGQKIAAVCTVGAATTATCLLTGAVGPGLVTPAEPDRPEHPPAQVREVLPSPEPTAPVQEAPAAEPAPTPEPAPESHGDKAASKPGAAPAPSEPVAPSPEEAEAATPASEVPRSDFGIEGSSGSSSAASESSPPSTATPRSTGGQGGSGGGSSPSSSGSEAEPAGAGVGFHG